MWSNDAYADQLNPVDGYAPLALMPGQTAAGNLVPAAPPLPTARTAAPALSEGALDVPASLAERIELCRFLAEANLLPQALRKQPANVLLIMHKALALQIPLSVALEHLHVIDNKVGHSAELLRALLGRAGHVLRWIEVTDTKATGELVLRHDPKNVRRETFTIADAQRMKLTSKDNWSKDPASMLVARVTTRLVSRHCPEVAVALGNLSAIDVEPEAAHPEPVKATAETGPSLEQQAEALYAEAQTAGDRDVLKEIGGRARQAGVLDVPVPGHQSLQAAILVRMQEIAESREPQEEPSAVKTTKSGKTA